MEKVPTQGSSTVDSAQRQTVEHAANFEGNESELMLERVQNPIIKAQIICVIADNLEKAAQDIKNDEWEPCTPEEWRGKEKMYKSKHRPGRMINADALETVLQESMGNRIAIEETVRAGVEADIERVRNVTDINYTKNEPTGEVIPLNWTVWTGERPTTKQMSIVEAHEKGHNIRAYEVVMSRFKNAFDIENVRFTEEDVANLKRAREQEKGPSEDVQPMTLEEERENYLRHYLFTDNEVAERMAQLKNYFGFKGTEEFTKEHLDYAREHYVEDTGMDNAMTLFFQGITSETEAEFLRLINNSGI